MGNALTNNVHTKPILLYDIDYLVPGYISLTISDGGWYFSHVSYPHSVWVILVYLWHWEDLGVLNLPHCVPIYIYIYIQILEAPRANSCSYNIFQGLFSK